MSRSDEERKHVLIDEAARIAAAQGGPAAGELVHSFYRTAPSADIVSFTPAKLAELALSLRSFAAQRRPGAPDIRVLDADSKDMIVEIVNDDMPFLVASVTAALTGMGFSIQLLLHPVIETGRAGGKESMMHIELAGTVPEERKAAIVSRLSAVLADVRAAVTDYSEMKARLDAMRRYSVAAPGSIPEADAEETAAFLSWLGKGNFLFLGYREYALQEGAPIVVAGSGLGVLRSGDVRVFDGLRTLTQTSPDVLAFLRMPELMIISKASRVSTVQRPVPMDAIAIRRFDASGDVVGLRLLVGLFTASSYLQALNEVPVLRQKVQRCFERSGFAADSYDGQTLRRLLDTFPRDEMFQIDEAQLLETALGIVQVKHRPRIALFVLRDPFARFVTCLVYMPRDRYNAEVRRRFSSILEQSFNGGVANESTTFDGPVAALYFLLTNAGGQLADPDAADMERRLAEAGRTWADRLHEALASSRKDHAPGALHRFANAFPSGYTERYSAAEAVEDMAPIEQVAKGAPIAISLAGQDRDLRLKTFQAGEPVALSDMLPVLENLGLRVLNEIPFEVMPRDSKSVWVQEFQLRPSTQGPLDVGSVRGLFEEAVREIWSGVIENDGFNRLVLAAGLSVRHIVILRAYGKLLRQAGINFSQAYLEETASAYPEIARQIVALFEAQFDPSRQGEGALERVETAHDAIVKALEKVDNLDQDRILRSYLTLTEQTLRTNFYQRDPAGGPKPYLSLKLASRNIDFLPLPRPMVEVFVYSPRMEGCHLRGGKVARGGIRWSDRKEDFRTEILGLMKAQMVKNAVIVPVGSKGGFVVRRPPQTGGRDALMAEVVECYKYLMRGLLDVTDNLRGDAVVPPPDVVRRDEDDPYLVVAADKGTATFSDIANGVAIEYGFWLGDAFASGGSVGYDHKVMGITAKGAWEAVKRHFRELGRNIQTTDFTCVGVGDMSGDVFGNGMLLSRHIRLIAAFNHMHIFVDPDPDAERSWVERKRVFDLPRSTWKDYNPAVLSAGGGVYERSAKSIALSPEARRVLGIEQEQLPPNQLIQALLRQDVDLLWFGGIGTYAKSKHETHTDAGDRANDSLRVNADTLRCKVIGEGANLALTQRGRIEYALKGGRLNTDAIDNSAGVDTSDHEVNIKIGVDDQITAGRIPSEERTAFLASMTDEVAHLVLRDNYLQTQALSVAEADATDALDRHVRLMEALERRGRLDRAVEFLPDAEAIAQRGAEHKGLTRPEMAVLLAYTKMVLYEELLASDLPDQTELQSELLAYFPSRMRDVGPEVLKAHRLRREIIATSVTNELVNRMGPTFIREAEARTSRDSPSIARACLVTWDVFGLPEVWNSIEALDNEASAATQIQLLLAVSGVVDQAVRWFMRSNLPLDLAARVRQFQPGIRALAGQVSQLLPENERRLVAERRERHVKAGVPESLAERIVVLNALSTAMDVVQISEETGRDLATVAKLYFGAGSLMGLLTLRRQARVMPVATEWQHLVVDALVDDSYAQQREIARRLVSEGVEADGDGLRCWVAQRAGVGTPVQSVLTDIARTTPPDLAMLTVASQRIRAIAA